MAGRLTGRGEVQKTPTIKVRDAQSTDSPPFLRLKCRLPTPFQIPYSIPHTFDRQPSPLRTRLSLLQHTTFRRGLVQQFAKLGGARVKQAQQPVLLVVCVTQLQTSRNVVCLVESSNSPGPVEAVRKKRLKQKEKKRKKKKERRKKRCA
jgi:hypothetical protein